MATRSDDITFGYRYQSSTDGRAGEPFLINRESLKDCHTHIRGGSGHGKSAFCADLGVQLMAPYDIYDVSANSASEQIHADVNDPQVHVINGLDYAYFHTIRYAAKQYGRPVRWFTIDPSRSYFFPPFQGMTDGPTSAIEQGIQIVESFDMDAGPGHGNLYFTSQSIHGIYTAVCELQRKQLSGAHVTWLDLVKHFERNQVRDQQHIKIMTQFLENFPQIQPEPGEQNTIDFGRTMREGEIVVGLFPPIGSGGVAKQLAGMFLYAAVQAALKSAYEIYPARPFIFIDEVQELAGRSFGRLLEHGRKQVSFILAHQNTCQLNNSAIDLRETVAENTDVKLHLTFSDDEREALLKQSTQIRDTLGRTSVAGNGLSIGESEFLNHSLDPNLVNTIAAKRMHGFVITKTEGRHIDPTPVRLEHVISKEAFEEYRHLPPPRVESKAVAARSMKPAKSPATTSTPQNSKSPKQKKGLATGNPAARLLARKRAAEKPKKGGK